MNNISAFLPLENKTALLVLMIVLIAFVVLLTVLGIVFIIALRKRRPVVKVLMSPTNDQNVSVAKSETAAASANTAAPVNVVHSQASASSPSKANDGDIIPTYIIESYDCVYYNILLQNSYPVNSSRRQERYSALMNELRSTEKVKERTAPKRELHHSAASHSVEKPKTNGIRIAMARRKQA